MTALIALKPDVARARILKAFARCGSITATAIELGCSYVTLYRWVNKLGLKVHAPQRSLRARVAP